jgi:hypothetical protein
MRHIYVNRASYLIAVLLLLGVMLSAWLRSEGIFLRLLEDAERQSATQTVNDSSSNPD